MEFDAHYLREATFIINPKADADATGGTAAPISLPLRIALKVGIIPIPPIAIAPTAASLIKIDSGPSDL